MVMSTTSMCKPVEPTISVKEHEQIVKALREAHAKEIAELRKETVEFEDLN